MSTIGKITRRTFVVGSVAVAGGFAIGYWMYKRPFENPLSDIKDGAALNPYVVVNNDGVTIIVPRAEMGQGVHTTLAAFVAEELYLKLEDVNVIHGPASKAYYNSIILEEGVPFPPFDLSWKAETMRDFMSVGSKFLAMQITGGSTSVPEAYEKMRVAGAGAREALLSAAARKWGISKSDVKADAGKITGPKGKETSYKDVANDVKDEDVPSNPALKPRSQWKLLGKSQQRVDMVSKVSGAPVYSIDIKLPNMLFGTVRMNPHLGSKMKNFDASEAQKMPGVKKVLELSQGGVAVLATNTWYAMRAAQQVKVDWDAPAYPSDTEGHWDVVRNSFVKKNQDSQLKNDGDVDEALSQNTSMAGEYTVPYLAHSTMEPVNAAALLIDGKLEIWAGNQNPTQVLTDAKSITGLDEKNIQVHTTMMGGAFGRRGELEFVKYAIETAKKMEGTPIKLTWSREEDTTHDNFRPLAMARYKVSVKDQKLDALKLELACPSVMDSVMQRIGMSPPPGSDNTIVHGAWDQPYIIPNHQVTGYKVKPLLPVSYWRSVGNSQNAFFMESIMDEVASTTKTDPFDLRLDCIRHEPSRKVLETLREFSGWDKPLPKDHYRGMAFWLSFGVPTAQVAEIEMIEGKIKVKKFFAVVDVGVAIDPGNIEAQVQSGIVYGLSAAVRGEITIRDGKIQQTNFHNYDGLRMHESPEIHVKILENGEKIRGIGEPGTPPAAPALSNAIFAATKVRIRNLPMKTVDFV